ncbi:MAG: UDP-N-acetyl-alpha-D-muramoyl-L-alanyl-L-glutamate epimerase [Thermoleophilaceae bacterium]|nr:UDP-N-acetyl-alpha-D-muramoyl-L-alanyl-L-glutamate epimerase [Thermoleophilaceae bacterium]
MADSPRQAAVAPRGVDFDPARFETFRFTGFDFDRARLTASLHYALDDELEFTERVRFPGATAPSQGASADTLDSLLSLLHLVAGVSYYKTAAPPAITVESGAAIDPSTSAFLERLYVDGLSEFAWTNGIDLRDRVRFAPNTHDAPAAGAAPALERRTAVPIGGGKDSVVALEALRAAGEPLVAFSVGRAEPILRTVAVAGVPHVAAERQLAPQLLELNAHGARNGHVPITAVVSAISCAAAPLYGFDAVAMSNERSASEGNLSVDGIEVNHQWSKGLAFERLLRAQLAWRAPGLEWFSLLRPFSELAIARTFARLPDYHQAFTSCNAVFRRDRSRRAAAWCGDCPKCRFVFLILAPFLPPRRLEAIFGGNLLEDPGQVDGFAELMAVGGHKPFECVGEEAESVAAFRLVAERPEWRDATVVRHVRQAVLPGLGQVGDPDRVLEPSAEHCLPPRFEAMASAFL